MVNIDNLVNEWAYRCEKGYPDMDSPSDLRVLKSILKEQGISLSQFQEQEEKEEGPSKKELIDLLPDNEFNMYEEGGLGVVERVGETHSVGHMGIAAWNTHAGTFRDFLYNTLPDLELVDRTRWLSNTKRVSEYCIEGERGFVSNHKADQDAYVEAIVSRLEKLGWL